MAQEQNLINSTTTQFLVSAEQSQLRLDVFLSVVIPSVSRSEIQRWIEAGRVTLMGKTAKAGQRVEAGDAVEIHPQKLEAQKIHRPVDRKEIVVHFEDEHLLVLDKPAGLPVHHGVNTGYALTDWLQEHCSTLSRLKPDRPGIVHRLDRDTTGLIVCAKTDSAHRALASQFKEKSNFRQYVALLYGAMEKETMVVESMIARDPSLRTKMRSFPKSAGDVRGKFARSHFRRTSILAKAFTLAEIQLETGRTHQIRLHACDIDHPVVGDKAYPGKAIPLPKGLEASVAEAIRSASRQMLHAKYLGFMHPETGKKIAFESALPKDFADVLAALT